MVHPTGEEIAKIREMCGCSLQQARQQAVRNACLRRIVELRSNGENELLLDLLETLIDDTYPSML